MREHGLGRIPSPPDPRDFRMADAVRELAKAPLPGKTWHSDRVLNQLKTPRCVGYAWAGWGIAMPVEDAWGDVMANDIYAACKKVDGAPQQDGSTVRAGAKVMRARGRIGTYFFAANFEEASEYVARWGPVVLGTIWTEGMFKPGLFTHVMKPTGKVAGGHAYLWLGIDKTYATIRNSWGTDWGKSGDARITLRDLRGVWDVGGEACAATERELAIGAP